MAEVSTDVASISGADSGPDSIPPKVQRRRVVVASTIGTTIEFYDFYAYATATVAVKSPHSSTPVDIQLGFVKVDGDWKLSGDAIQQLISMGSGQQEGN